MNYHRQSIRLKGYDYTQAGVYFFTVCTPNRECLFGNVVDGKMVLNDAGMMVQSLWDDMPTRFPHIETDYYVIMPNHIHGIISIVGAPLVGAHSNVDTFVNRAGTRPAPTVSLGDTIGVFKSMTTNEYIRGVKQNKWRPFNGKLWQRNYWEHIIRSENDLNRTREYIIYNPMQWALDEENPDRQAQP